MANVSLFFEVQLGTSEAYVWDVTTAEGTSIMWTLEVVTATAAQVTVAAVPSGQIIAYPYYLLNATRFSANTKTTSTNIITPYGRTIRAFSTVSDTVIRGYGVRNVQ